ncbi:Putative peptidoglycan binding domain-containing protein [Nocardia farcinica]|uniref:Putative peptidoglycan binding domain n=2 Tax=Nocardia farcinica TaxID=37329 RepID=A0A0H5NEG9_NOCFR|nr:peptidoglycan-binding protein [Nocardia farcinica]AXK88806.1 peptidoglycan-binding protein [Nocardia farcinica]PFX04079.1 hypothetical protein CJ469_01953 [Nocardia farcinica]PFX10237.1 hypothetical protein CJ468_01084 [Nocardia farcinica]CRY73542.1 Putative peptidoglycan binding domain [Nocardia farcinica]SIT29581.1 Putative peptidoglycan binding domain-containing protein [Nocardia farcinica]
MATTRTRMAELLAFARARHGLPYAYGGSFTRDPRDSTDCSGVVFSAAAIVHGIDPYRRYGSTETLRLARMNRTPAPCGLLPASSAAAIPADAPLRVGVQHGGGGPNSHTACSFFIDGRQFDFESRGWPGVLLNNGARAWNDRLFHDFWYYPGPVGEPDPRAFPLPPGYYYGPYEGPEESISGRAGEPTEWVDGLRRWQTAAGIPADGIYGEATRRRAIEYQIPAGLMPDGLIGPKTWALAIGSPRMSDTDLYKALTEFMQGYLGPLISDVKDIREQLTGSRDTHYLDPERRTVDVARSFPGWPEILGKKADGTGRLPVDVLGELLRRGQ